ncbi:MAG: HAMP domain-containing histidine kinase [Bacteroidaceae bacterium]|nr:HAMP domain-containing histidine kinase [Bacteroidaceae bacterium]
MKLIYRITLRLALVLLPVIALWAYIFYNTMVGEINDESDDSLVEFADIVIRRHLVGEPLPQLNSGSNNSYTIVPLPEGETVEPYMTFHDEMVYIPEQRETEPARVLTTVYMGDDDRIYKLTVAMPTFERNDLLSAIFWYTLVLYVILIITILVATTLIVYRSMRPLYYLLGWLDRYIPGRRPERLPSSNVVEFDKLNNAAQTTLDRIEEQFELQKQFIGNASHELQTPLAVIGNRVEWIIDNTQLSEEQYAELAKIQHSLSRLVRLNRTLLLLTKIDNGQFPELADVDIAALVRGELEIYTDLYSHRSITASATIADCCIVRMNDSLANTLITNLLKNAFVHSADGAQVTVTLTTDKLIVANSGDEPLDETQIFERFYHSGKSSSTGLGLSLVNSICRYYGFEKAYSYKDGQHIFIVEFKQ